MKKIIYLLNTITDPYNNSTDYTYDKLNRLESIIKENDTYTNYYDNLGRIAKLTSNTTDYLYEYDFAKRLSSYKYDNYSTNYDYDKDNLVNKKEEKLSNTLYTYNYEYNKESALTKLTNNNSVFNYNYDILSRLSNQNINNKYVTSYKYITSGNKTSTVIEEINDNGTIYNYKYDKLGNITEIYKDNILIHKYYYDMYSELIKEDDLINNVTKQYVYDNYGNILSKKTYEYNTTNLLKEDSYEYTDSSWQDLLTKFNNEEITYDEIGNPLTIGNKTLTWMNGRELASYNDGTTNIQYKYNLDGIRTSKIVNGIETKYYLEGRSIIFEDRNGDMLYYIYNGSELLGFVYKNKTYYYHKNIFGDIIGILDSNYNELVTYKYDSWGALVNITDNSNINLGTINPFRYRSYYYDTETGLYYLNSRYYNPQIGRFINADGYVSTGQGFTGNNMFQYCGNNFPNMKDYDGQWFLFAAVVVVGCLLLSGCEKKKEPPKDYREENSKNINCYAYAFDLDFATNPGSIARKNGYKGMIYEDKYVNTVEETASYVLADMATLDKQVRIVENIDDAKENEYIVALKVGNVRLAEAGGYADYHFAVLLSDGTWADKPGSTPSRWNKIDGTAAVWDAGMNKEYYNSSSIFFAVEK